MNRANSLRAVGLALVLAGGLLAAPPIRTGTSPHFLVDAWETDQGLPENSTRQVVQVPDGSLWFGTMAGLVRFNGDHFDVLTSGNTASLPSDGIVNLHLDGAQRLWVSTLRGLVVSAPGRWRSFQTVPQWTGNYVRSFAENAGVLCLTSFDGRVFRATAEGFQELARPPGTEGQTYYGHVDRAGQVWVAQAGFFGRWDGARWVESSHAASVTREFRGAGQARDGALLVLADSHLLRLEGELMVGRLPLAQALPPVWQITEDSDGRVWLPSWGAGLYYLGPKGAVQRLSARDGLLSDSFRFVFEDRERNLWTGGGNGGGLIRLKSRTVQTHGLDSGLPERLVKAVVEDGAGNIILGTYGKGLVRFEDGHAVPWVEPALGSGGLYIQCLWADRQGRLWVGTYGSGLQLWERGEMRMFAAAESGGRNVNAVFEDSRGRIWVGASDSAMLYSDLGFVRQTTTDGKLLRYVMQFAESPTDGTLWAVSEEGVFRNGGSGWENVAGGDGSPVMGAVFLRFDAAGSLWVGGPRLGLRRYKANHWSAITESEGLPTRVISGGVEDGLGFWWWASNRGLVRVAQAELDQVADGARPALAQAQVFNQSDGLLTLEFASMFSSTSLRDTRGRLWFATPRGVAMVDPRNLRLNPTPPPMRVESVSYVDGEGRPHLLEPASATTVRLPPGSRKLEARFAVLTFAAPEKVQLHHRFERDGVLISDALQTARTFQSDLLVPGDYRVAMSASNNDGGWNRQGVTLRFVVEPQYWETGWFRVLVLLGLTGTVGGATWWVTHQRQVRQLEQIRQDQARAAERDRLETVLEANRELETFAYSVSHDLRAPLRNICGFLELLVQRTAGKLDGEEARLFSTVTREAARLSLLIDKLLAFSRLGRAELSREPVALGELVDEVRAELATEIGARVIEWRIGPLPVVQGDRTLLRQVVANLLSNAVKFTRLRPVAVIAVGAEAGADPRRATIVVADNGVGFNPKYQEKLFGVFERLHTAREFDGLGIGLAIVRRIVERHGGKIWAEGSIDKGAKFQFTVPLSHA